MTENTDTTTEPIHPLTPPPRPALRRSRTDRVIGGVAGGFGQWLGIDPVIVRVVLVVLAIFGGSGLLLYAAGWLFVPDEGASASEAERFIAKGQRPGSTTRTVLIVIAAILIAAAVVNLLAVGPMHAWGFTGGGSFLLLLAVGGVVLWLVNRDPAAATTAPLAPPPPGDAPQPALAVSAAEAETSVLPTGYAYGGPGNYPGYRTPATASVSPLPPKARSYLGLATLSLSLITMGVLGSLSLTGVANIPVVAVLAAGLAVLGLGLVVGSMFGRARWLIALAIPLLMVTALVAVFPANVQLPKSFTVGDRSWAPTTILDATAPHSLTVGDAVLDLTGLAIPAGNSTPIPVRAEVGIGQLVVKVPRGMRVQVHATARTGEVRIYGLPARNGQDVTVSTELPGVVPPMATTIVLDAQVGIGSLEVSRA